MIDKNILVITSWSYNDALIQTYTLPYIDIISKNIPEDSKIFLVTLEKKVENIIIKNAKIQHISIKYNAMGIKGGIMWLKLLFALKILIWKEKINYIHAWCTPAGMIAYLLAVFSKRKIIIDSYEPHAESMLENGSWKKSSLAFNVLSFFEKKLARRADFLIATTRGFAAYSVEKYNLQANKIYVKPACVDLEFFSKKNIKNFDLLAKLNLKDKIICVYAGKFGGIYLDQEVFDFIKVAENFWGEKFRFLLLTSHLDVEINKYRETAMVKKETLVKYFVPFNQIPDYIGLADFALTPVKPVPSKRFCTPIKDGEYWALGLPVVITKDISDDSEIIDKEDIGYVLRDLNNYEYLMAIEKINNLIESNSREDLFLKIRNVAIKNRNFNNAQNIYNKIYC